MKQKIITKITRDFFDGALYVQFCRRDADGRFVDTEYINPSRKLLDRLDSIMNIYVKSQTRVYSWPDRLRVEQNIVANYLHHLRRD